MAFILSKPSRRKGEIRQLYYLVRSYRIGKNSKRKTILILGKYKTVEEYLESVEQEYKDTKDRLRRFKKELDDFKKYGKVPSFVFGSAYNIRKRLEWSVGYTKTDVKTLQKKVKEIKKMSNLNFN